MNSDRTSQKLIHVMTFGTSHAAHVAMAALADHGITAHVQGDALADALSYYGPAVNKVQLMTFEDDAEQALQILQEMEAESRQDDGPWGDGESMWLCEECEEQNARTFDQCWACGADRPAEPRWVPVPTEDRPITTAEASVTTEAFVTTNADEESPYRAPAVGGVLSQPSDVRNLEDRAVRAASISTVLLPVGFYALYLCYRCYAHGIRSRKLLASTILSLVTSSFTSLMIVYLR